MRKPAMTSDAFPHRGAAAPFRVAFGLALAAGAGMMLWGVGTPSAAFASELVRNTASETPMTLEDRVAALTAELAQVKAETAKLREGHSDTSVELSHIRASLANAEIGLDALRTTTDENKTLQGDTAARIASNLAQLKDETLHLRLAQGDTAAEIGSLRAGVANSEIGLDRLRTTTGEIRQQIQRTEVARDATSSIAKSHKHHGQRKWTARHGHRKWMAQR